MIKRNIAFSMVVFVLTIPGVFANPGRPFDVYEALENLKVYRGNIIDKAQVIKVKGFEIAGFGGICLGIPIFAVIQERNIIPLAGIRGKKYEDGTLEIKSDAYFISGVVVEAGGVKYLVLGRSLDAIVDFLYE